MTPPASGLPSATLPAEVQRAESIADLKRILSECAGELGFLEVSIENSAMPYVGPSFQHQIHSNKFDDVTKVNFAPELIQKLTAEEATPRTKAEIVAMLRAEGDQFASFLESLPEAFLAERVTMRPGMDPATKTRFEMLLSPKEHEMHHRAQLMVLQRMIGQVPHLTRQMRERMAQMQAGASQGR